MKECNVKNGMPSVEIALLRLRNFLKYNSSERVVKVIHGYGSHGIGGEIRTAIRSELAALSDRGAIVGYIPGEAFVVPMGFADLIAASKDLLRNDPDYHRVNDGITYVVCRR